MSTNIRWRPESGSRSLDADYSFPLKDALREEFGDGEKRITGADIPFLRGLKAAKVGGAEELLELVQKHGAIIVWEES